MKPIIKIVIFLVMFLISHLVAFGQLGYGSFLVCIYDNNGKVIEFKEGETVNQIVGYSEHSKEKGRSLTYYATDSTGVYDSLGVYGFVAFSRPITKLEIFHKNEKMVVNIKNSPEKVIDLIIKKLVFKPGNYELDIQKLNRKLENFNSLDITPYNEEDLKKLKR